MGGIFFPKLDTRCAFKMQQNQIQKNTELVTDIIRS